MIKKKRFYQKDRKGKNKNQHLTLTGHVSDLLMSLRTRRKGEEALKQQQQKEKLLFILAIT